MACYQLSVISYQLSAFSFQLSAFSFQLSAFSFQLSVISLCATRTLLEVLSAKRECVANGQGQGLTADC
ncbi:hypothetical protein LYNGBM3L_19730 [Moorena producens 3L]|uniref:Uncharacterized protein n=1 Tax=Moorena producens 3L TaxID=489825 RepID=F4XST0_9CYAN|nr:hypothetical protein LYNGBM3L_19730 [Moorena producens 3L]